VADRASGTNKGDREEKRAWNALLLAKIALDGSMNKFQGDLQRITIRPEVSRVVYETEMAKVEGGAEPKWAKPLSKVQGRCEWNISWVCVSEWFSRRGIAQRPVCG
jgi:hypothetical protein